MHVALARTTTLALAGLTAVHALVAAGVVSPEHVGGGRYPDRTTARVAEGAAAGLTAGAAWVAASRGGWARRPGPRAQRATLWTMTGVFTLSTIGSLAGRSPIEQRVMAPLAATLAVASGVLAATTRPVGPARPTTSPDGAPRTWLGSHS